jgi:hypothetical protein
MQEKPEVIACLRYLHSDDALPDWVGKLKDKVDYAEILRREGIELPAMVDDDAASASASEDDRVNEEGEEDVQEGTPAQGSTIVANDFSTRANAEGRGATQTNARRRTAQTHADVDAEARGSDADVDAEEATETRKEAQEKTVMRRISKAPDPLVNPNPEVITPVIKKPRYTKRGMGGSAVLEEGMDVAEARASRVG